jgi:hypothetical protein
VLDEQPTGFKNVGFLKTSQLHKCGFAYIQHPLLRHLIESKSVGTGTTYIFFLKMLQQVGKGHIILFFMYV